MVGSGPHQVESIASQRENPFANLEHRRVKRAACTLCIPAKAILEIEVTSLKSNIIKPCKGKSTSEGEITPCTMKTNSHPI